MYHSISDEDGHATHPYYETRTSVRSFAQQMGWLRDHGYRAIGLHDLASGLTDQNIPAAAVVITFDDGFRDFYTNAFPILSETGFTATMFLPTGYVEQSRKQFKGKQCMTWNEVRELQNAGIGFGSHTVTHPQLHSFSSDQIEDELKLSKQAIENAIGVEVKTFAYPYAFPETDHCFTQRLQSMLAELGYSVAVSTVIGTVRRDTDEFFLKRLPINEWDDPALFQAKLEGGYNWLRCLQRWKKRLN